MVDYINRKIYLSVFSIKHLCRYNDKCSYLEKDIIVNNVISNNTIELHLLAPRPGEYIINPISGGGVFNTPLP